MEVGSFKWPRNTKELAEISPEQFHRLLDGFVVIDTSTVQTDLHPTDLLQGSQAEDAVYFPNRGYNGVDTSGVLVLTYPGFTCVCAAAKDSDSPGFFSVQGERKI